ncbi:MAG: lysylphosphatidylglycerol synthase domain-containing protein [Caldilineaceae bacterium]
MGRTARHDWRIHAGWLLLSGILLVTSWFVEVSMWRTTLSWVGGRVDYAAAVRIWFASILVRYIPGNVWQPLGMTVLAQRAGVRPEATVASIALYQAVNLLSVIPFFAGYLLLGGDVGIDLAAIAPWLAGLAAIPLVIFLARPGWLLGLLNLALVRVGRSPLDVSLGSAQLLRLLLVAVGDWLLWGASFAALTASLDGDVLAQGVRVGALLFFAYPIAYAVGYLSFLTPGGLAVREGTLALLLIPVLGATATVAALLMRLWQVVLELLVVVFVMRDT